MATTPTKRQVFQAHVAHLAANALANAIYRMTELEQMLIVNGDLETDVLIQDLRSATLLMKDLEEQFDGATDTLQAGGDLEVNEEDEGHE